MKKLLILTVAAAAATLMGTADIARADHCPSGGNSFRGSSFRPSYGYSYRPTYSSYGYRPTYSRYGYRPSFNRGTSIGFSTRGFSINFGSGFRSGFGGRRGFGHRH